MAIIVNPRDPLMYQVLSRIKGRKRWDMLAGWYNRRRAIKDFQDRKRNNPWRDYRLVVRRHSEAYTR